MSPDRRTSRRSLISTGGLGLVTVLAGCASVLGGGSEPVTDEWTTPVPRTTGGVSLYDGTVYVCTESGLTTVDLATGEPGWEFSTGQNETSSQPIIADDTVFFGTIPFRDNQATLYAASTTNEELWSVPLPGGASTSAVADGSVFTASGVMGSGEYGLHAFDVRSGERDWGVSLETHPVGSSPTVVEGTVYVESGGFAAFDAETGTLNWRIERDDVEVGEVARHSPTVEDGTAYFSHSIEPEVYAFDAETGAKQWMTRTNARASKPVVVDGTLYVGTTDSSPDSPHGKLYALDTETGEESWSVATGDAPLEAPVVDEGAVYTAGHDTLYAIDGDSGEILWEDGFDNGISAPVLADDRAIVDTPRPGSAGHELHALSW